MPLNMSNRMVTTSRETRDTLFLLGVIAVVLLLQMPHLPWWCSAMGAGVLGLRAGLAWYQRPLPAARWRIGLLLLAIGATWASFRTLLGQDAGVTLVFVLLALKTLELRARRDAFVVFFLGFFALLTHFFYSQSLLTALGITLALWGLLTALINAHMPAGRPPLAIAARLSATMMLVGAPIMVTLFLLFPRVAPLWGLPSTNTGRSGLSAQVEVGQMAQIALDDSVAMHVEFDGPTPPTSNLYFRGPVLTRFDGRTWSPAYSAPNEEATGDTDGPAVRYRVTQEPNGLPWLLTLEATAQAPLLPAQAVAGTADLQWRTARPLSAVTRFTAVAHTHYRYGPHQPDATVREALQLPPGFNPRTLQLAKQLLSQPPLHTDPTIAHVQAALALLRDGGYRYTLEPGLFGRHTADEFWFDRKAGFCEHIASSFVVLMRAMGVPARMVTGYQGGEPNPIDGFWVVRQRDAHAWTEVWHPRQGWLRVDPTAAVAPDRTDGLARLEAPPGLVTATLLRVDPNLIAYWRQAWDAVNNAWNQSVLNYTQDQQFDLLRALGVSRPDLSDLGYAMMGLVVLLSLVGAAWTLRERWQRDPWIGLLQAARQRLQRAGYPVPANATPRQLVRCLDIQTSPAHDTENTLRLRQWLLALEAQRYDPDLKRPLRELRQQFRHLHWPRRAPDHP